MFRAFLRRFRSGSATPARVRKPAKGRCPRLEPLEALSMLAVVMTEFSWLIAPRVEQWYYF